MRILELEFRRQKLAKVKAKVNALIWRHMLHSQVAIASEIWYSSFTRLKLCCSHHCNILMLLSGSPMSKLPKSFIIIWPSNGIPRRLEFESKTVPPFGANQRQAPQLRQHPTISLSFCLTVAIWNSWILTAVKSTALIRMRFVWSRWDVRLTEGWTRRSRQERNWQCRGSNSLLTSRQRNL